MKTPELMLDITEKVVKAVNKPVSVKTRLGWDDDSKLLIPPRRTITRLRNCSTTIHGHLFSDV